MRKKFFFNQNTWQPLPLKRLKRRQYQTPGQINAKSGFSSTCPEIHLKSRNSTETFFSGRRSSCSSFVRVRSKCRKHSGEGMLHKNRHSLGKFSNVFESFLWKVCQPSDESLNTISISIWFSGLIFFLFSRSASTTVCAKRTHATAPSQYPHPPSSFSSAVCFFFLCSSRPTSLFPLV